MKRKILFLLVIILSLLWIPKVGASNKYNLVKETYENIYYVQNGMPDHYGSDSQFKFTLNGTTAFCMDPIAPITKYEYDGVQLSSTSYDRETQDYLNKIIYYGYDYPNHQNERYYMATQALIWERISNYLIEFYTERYGYGEYIDVSNEKNEIISLINNHDYVLSFANKTYNYDLIDYLEFKDDNLNNFEISESSWDNITIEDNKLKLFNLQNFVGTINIKLKKKMYRNDNPMYYYEDGTQSMITGGKLGDIETSFSIKVNGAKIKINKVASNSMLPIKNANIKFNIINTKTNEYVYVNGTKDIPINTEGYLITNPIPYGEYNVVEVETDEQYQLNETPSLITVNQDTINEDNIYEINFYNDLKKGNINIVKIDKDSKNPIPRVEFELYALNDIRTNDGILHYSRNQLIENGMTDENGLLTFGNLIYGDYYIKELNPIEGYIKDNNLYEIYLRNQNYNIIVENELEKGSIVIQKYGQIIDNDANEYKLKELENVEYKLIANEDIISPVGTIYYKKGDTVSIKNTDKNGIINFSDLILGDYCFIETKTLDGYQLDENLNCYDLKIYYGINIEKINYLKRGSLKINKLDKDSKLPIKNSNIQFQIKNLDTNQYIYINDNKELEVNEEGYLIINDLLYGRYEITEVFTNSIYELNNKPLIIEINDKTLNKENIIEVNFYNKRKNGSIDIIKKGEKFNFKTGTYNFANLSNIEFTLYANEDIFVGDLGIIYTKGDIVDIRMTNSKGEIKFNNLVLGQYCIKETKQLDNYILDDNSYCFNLLENNNEKVELINYLKKGNLKLNKLDQDSKLPIKNSNIQFQIKNLGTNRYIYIDGSKNLTISDEGYLIINNLPYGTYEIKEISTTDDYLLNKETKIIELNDTTIENNTLEINFFNKKKHGQIIINKRGEIYNYKTKKYSYKSLDNIEFTLIANEDIITSDGVKHYNKDDIIMINTTNIDGNLIFDNLILGKYCLIETKTKDGYIIDENKYCFDLLEKNSQDITLTNYLKKGNLKIIKIDSSTKEPIKNVTFEFYNDNNYIGKYKTDANGIIELKDIPALTYQIKEIKTPKNYILSDEVYTIDLNKSNEIIIENTKKIILPNTKKNDYTIVISGLIIMTGLVLYKYDSKKEKN